VDAPQPVLKYVSGENRDLNNYNFHVQYTVKPGKATRNTEKKVYSRKVSSPHTKVFLNCHLRKRKR